METDLGRSRVHIDPVLPKVRRPTKHLVALNSILAAFIFSRPTDTNEIFSD